MLKFFQPKMYIKNFMDLDLELLKNKGIKLLICDIDNTLVKHTESEPTNEVRIFIKNITATEIIPILISNNNKKRVSRFADDLDVDIYYSAKKPLRGIYKHILQKYGFKSSEIAALGDQILTDILGGNRMHLFTILTDPLHEKDLVYTKINRIFEKKILNKLEEEGKFKRGSYYNE